MTNNQLCVLAMRTGQWCNAVMEQGKRFLSVVEKTDGKMPWEDAENGSMFLAEKTFLITAIHHAIQSMNRLNDELKSRGDMSFEPVLNTVATEEERETIRNWRNMNEHDLDYLTGKGRKQDKFVTAVKKESYQIETNAFTTFIHGGIGIFLLGGIEMDKLLMRFKESRTVIQEKVQEVFYSTYT